MHDCFEQRGDNQNTTEIAAETEAEASAEVIIPYATVDELQAGWRWLTDAERLIAAVLLERASAMLDVALSDAGKTREDLDAVHMQVAKAIVCDMVRYSMVTSSSVWSGAMGDGVIESVAPGDLEGGGLLLTKRHREMLGISVGIGGGRAGFIGAAR